MKIKKLIYHYHHDINHKYFQKQLIVIIRLNNKVII